MRLLLVRQQTEKKSPKTGKNNTRPVLIDRDGRAVNVTEALCRDFGLRAGESVMVSVVADDFMHERVPFDKATADAVHADGERGYFVIADGTQVRVHETALAGPWPVMGVDATGHPCLWDAQGNAQDGDPAKALSIMLKVREDGAGDGYGESPEGEDGACQDGETGEG